MALNETECRRPSDEEKRIEALASTLDVGIMIYDRNDILVAASSHFLRYFDVDPELLQPGARLRDLFSATYDAGARVLGSLNGQARQISREDWIAERIAIHWRERYESVDKLSDGRWIRQRKRRMPDGVLVAISEEITDQKSLQEETAHALKKAELFNTVLDNLGIQVIVKDPDLRFVMVNEAFCQILGVPRKHILGKRAGDFVGHELAARFEEIERAVLETGKPYDALEEFHMANGTVVKAITRIRRTGKDGEFTVTSTFDKLSHLKGGKNAGSSRNDPVVLKAMAGDELNSVKQSAGPRPRALVIDEIGSRAADRVAQLKNAGFDAVATSCASESIAFLDAAEAMGLKVDEVEISEELALALRGRIKPDQHPVLRLAVERKLAAKTVKHKPSFAPVKPIRPANDPVLAVVPPAPPSQPSAMVRSEPGRLAAAEFETQGTKPNKPVAAADRIRVLVAEDNDVNQIVFEQILEGIGVDYRIVGNGQEAVAAWRAANPNLILMDVSMPVMNGLQAVQAIRDAEAGEATGRSRVPVIAVTAHAMNGDSERCLAAGMDDYLSKPVDPEKLEAIIQKWVGKQEQFRATG